MTQTINSTEGDINITDSICVSIYPSDGKILEEVMRHSDAVMYRAKSKGVGCELTTNS